MDDVAAGAFSDEEYAFEICVIVDPGLVNLLPRKVPEPEEGGEAGIAGGREAVLGRKGEEDGDDDGFGHACKASVDSIVHEPIGLADAKAATVEVKNDGKLIDGTVVSFR